MEGIKRSIMGSKVWGEDMHCNYLMRAGGCILHEPTGFFMHFFNNNLIFCNNNLNPII